MLSKITVLRLLITFSLVSLTVFIFLFVSEVGMGHPVLYALLTSALFFKILKILFEWYHYAGLRNTKSDKINLHLPDYSVDIFTTACPEEPFEMIENTLKAMVAVRYPHKNYLCVEGNNTRLRKLCDKLGVIYVSRNTRKNAKAGNINNALKHSTGEICVILDPDHIPFPDFLDHVLPHFSRPEVGFVQVVQAYKNQKESLIARAAAEQTYIFYGPFMNVMNNYGTAQAIGANCTFRRSALESIGGHAAGLTEDMHTSMLLHAKGWKSVYVPKIVSRGLVPSGLSAYYKQQLKWSRGTFDLWLNLYPRLFKNFTWKQKLHYGLLPIYYLFGLITLIDIIVPVYSLGTGDYPWHMNPLLFFIYFIPFIIFSLLTRLYAQKWLYGEEEFGFHMLGGIIRVGTWWVYILGFIYTLFNIKVPYIPTQKTYSPKDELMLGLPNLLVALICILAAVYGLERDWQPYSFLMAAFALANGVILLSAFIISQSRWMFYIRDIFWSWRKNSFFFNLNISYTRFNLIAAPSLIAILVVFSVLMMQFSFVLSNNEERYLDQSKKSGGFYIGIYLPSIEENNSLKDIKKTEKETDHQWSIISTYLPWGDAALPTLLWDKIINHGAIPMITWEPWTNLFSQYKDHPDLNQNKKVFFYITEGYFDDYIDHMAKNIRSLDYPVYLRFAHEMENPMYPWSHTGGNSPEEFKNAWIYVHARFEAMGVHNVSWVWSPWKAHSMEEYFPYGSEKSDMEYVDWIGLTVLNYGKVNLDQKGQDFQEIYKPFRDKIDNLSWNKPIMLAEFGSTSYEDEGLEWYKTSLQQILKYYPEINSVVLFQSHQDKNWIADWRPDQKENFINWTIDLSILSPVLKKFNTSRLPSIKPIANPKNASSNKNIIGNHGNFTWQVNGKPFYLKGVCYFPGYDLNNGYYPLTRKQLENDFSQIKAMGANTIRRYDPSVYDYNIINIAEEYDLKVMYGFWFDPTIDYYKDQAAVKDYEDKVIKYVKKYKGKKNIIAWNIGNETYGLLSKYYSSPYLDIVQRFYLNFLEELAQKIHMIDPERPVFSSENQDYPNFESTILNFRQHVPSIDIMGINSYYKQNIEQLQKVYSQYDTLRPYAITEFGPQGYWNREKGFYKDNIYIIERSSISKAKWYEEQWNNYITAYKGYNVGGMAFSWRDRYEGTATWFGITDYKGRLKPSYYYLQRAWKDEYIHSNQFPDLAIVGDWHPIKKGEKIWMTAGIINGYEGPLTYKWEILETETWINHSSIIVSASDKKSVEIRMPDTKSDYRIYVYATDSLGNVVTASRALIKE